MERVSILDETEDIFRKAGFYLSHRCCSRPSCFDFTARRDNLLTFVKIHNNIGSTSPNEASELGAISSFFEASSILVGERTKNRRMENDTVYSRYGIYAVTPKTLKDALFRGLFPLVMAGPGGYYVRINGELVRKRRHELGLSIGKLAEMIGISRRTLYGYERGMANASVSTAYRLEWILGTAVIEPVNIFERKKEKKGIFTTAKEFISKRCPLYKVLKKLMQFNFKIAQVKKAPFDFVAKIPEENLSILGGIAVKREQNLERRTEEIVSVGKVVGAQPILITSRKDEVPNSNDIPLFGLKEIEKIRKPEDFVGSLF